MDGGEGGGLVDGGGGGERMHPTYIHMHTHARTCTRTHACMTS